MRRWLWIVFVALSAAGCSEPECAQGEIRIGNECRRLRRDSGTVDDESNPATSATSDASSALDSGAILVDAGGGLHADGSRALVDSGDAFEDASDAPACGDGIVNGTELCDSKINAGEAGACPTAMSCTDQGCVHRRVTGSAAGCDARCESDVIRQCSHGDGCCPADCTFESDMDCSSDCGDGFVDKAKGETCEGASCPTEQSCVDGKACTTDVFSGSAINCSASCAFVEVTQTNLQSDGCCPSGGSEHQDPDCPPRCGNHVIESGELCEDDCPTVATCTSTDPCLKATLFGNGCAARCTKTAVTEAAVDGCCIASKETPQSEPACPGCGNGTVEGSEQCDKGNLNGLGGCSASCMLQDDPTTRGNDLPGVIACNKITCTGGLACVEEAQGPNGTCVSAASMGIHDYTCDGPEDCPTGTSCWTYEWDTTTLRCRSTSELNAMKPPVNEGSVLQACHKSEDCAFGGRCGESAFTFRFIGRCDFP